MRNENKTNMGIDKWLYDYGMDKFADKEKSKDILSFRINESVNSMTYKDKVQLFVMANMRRLKVYENIDNVISPIIY